MTRTWPAPDNAAAAHAGLNAALSRLDAELGATDGDPFVPLFESLQWLYALDEGHAKAAGDGGRDYYAARSASTSGQTLQALLCARGLTLHQLLRAERKAHLYPSETLFPGDTTFVGLLWRWAPLPETDRRDRYGARPLYARLVEQKTIRPPLTDAVGFVELLSGV